MPSPLGIVASGVDNWTPALLPNLALWLDASDPASLPATSPVPTWSDKSGNARHYTAAGSARPTIEPTGGPAGKPCVRFDGSLNMMSRVHFNPQRNNWLIASVVRTDSGLPTTARGYLFLADNTHVGVSQCSESTQWYGSVFGGIGWTNFVPGKVNYWDLQLAWRDGTNHGMRSKGVDQGGTIPTLPAAPLGNSTIGGDAYGTKTACRISEIVVASGVWTTADRGRLEGYLARKWSL